MKSIRAIGFCGSIGCGKSLRSRHLATVTEETAFTPVLKSALASYRVPPRLRIDCDVVGHQTYLPESATFNAVVARFGADIAHGTDGIDRRRLGQKVFADPSALRDLNAIVWPAITANVTASVMAFEDAHPGGGIVLMEGALLIEMPQLCQLCDVIWVYHANREVAMQRILLRDGVSESQAKQRMDSQPPLEARLQLLRDQGRDDNRVSVFDTSTQSVEDGCAEAEIALMKFIDPG